MKTNLTLRTKRTALAAALLGCMAASSVSAQDQQLDTQNLAPTSIGAAGCADVDWNRELLERYPRLAEGCQEVVISEGAKWARFEADFVGADRDGSVRLDFRDRQGRSMEELTLMPTTAQRVLIDGREVRFSQLTRGQLLNVYVPEGMFAVAVEPGATPEQLAEIVSPATLLAQADTPEPRADTPEPRAAPVVRQLPSTAGPLPFVMLAGIVSLLGGLGLTITRRFRTKEGKS